MTLKEIVYDIYNLLHSGRTNDTEIISYYQIEFIVKNTRNTLIRQDLQKGRTVSENIIQHIYNMKVSPVDTSDNLCTLFTGCYIVRTDLQLPKFLEGIDRDMITSIQPSSITSQNYTFVPRSRVSYLGRNKWNKNMPFAFLRDRYLYLIADFNTEFVTVEGILENPEDLRNYVDSCNGNKPCYDDESEYSMSSWMVEIAKQMIIKNNMLLINGVTDISEDGNPNYKQPVQKPPLG